MERDHLRGVIRHALSDAANAVAESREMVAAAEARLRDARETVSAARERTARARDRLQRAPRAQLGDTRPPTNSARGAAATVWCPVTPAGIRR